MASCAPAAQPSRPSRCGLPHSTAARLAWLAIFGAVIWFVYKADSMSVPITTPHTAVIEIRVVPEDKMFVRAVRRSP